MPVESINEWSVKRDGDNVVIEAWLPKVLAIGATGRNNSGVGKNGQAKGSRGVRVSVFHQHIWTVPVASIRRVQQGLPMGWTVASPGLTLMLLFSNRKQNPNYPIQTADEISTIMGV